MATIFQWSGYGLAPGAFTTASAGSGDTGPSGQGASGVGQTIVASGSRSPRIQLAQQASSGCNTFWNFSSTDQIAGRFYIEITSALAANHEFIRLASGGTRLWSMNLSSNNNRINMYDSNNTLVVQSPANSIEVGTLYRVDFSVDANADSATVNVYNGESTTPLFTLSPSSPTITGGFTRFQIGHPLTTPTAEVQLWDDIEVADELTPPGPVTPAATYVSGMTMWDGTAEQDVSAWLWDGVAEHLLGYASTTPQDAGWHPVFGMPTFRDEFDGAVVDPANWSVKDAAWFGNTPDRAVIRSDHTFIDNSELVLRATWRDTPSGSPARWHDTGYIDHRSGGTPPGTSSSSTIYSQQYGRWEVCATTPTGPNTLGTLAAFWLRCNSTPGEIDVMEAWGYAGTTPTSNGQFPGSSTLTFHSSTTSGTVNGKPYTKTLGRVNQRLGDYSSSNWSYMANNLPLHPAFDGYHTWGFEYMPDYIRADYDGQEFFYVTPTTPDPEDGSRTCAWLWDSDFFGSPFHMRCNLHVGMSETYWGVPDPDNRSITSDPLDFKVRYIRAWEYIP